jgi:hypothetical protein
MKGVLPSGAFDLDDLLVDQVQGIVEVANQRHGFGQERFQDRVAGPAAARLPERDTSLERGNSFSWFATLNECLTI